MRIEFLKQTFNKRTNSYETFLNAAMVKATGRYKDSDRDVFCSDVVEAMKDAAYNAVLIRYGIGAMYDGDYLVLRHGHITAHFKELIISHIPTQDDARLCAHLMGLAESPNIPHRDWKPVSIGS